MFQLYSSLFQGAKFALWFVDFALLDYDLINRCSEMQYLSMFEIE